MLFARLESMFIPRRIVEEKLKSLLTDDLGQGDVTSAVIIPAGKGVEAEIVAKEDGVVAGIEESIILAEYLGLSAQAMVIDGEKITNKQVLIQLSGDAQSLFSGERTLLNLLSRMSGIATQTRHLSQKIANAQIKTKIAATRKSAPGLLYFDKKAVVLGGGDPHRLHLDDMVLIKDNHIAIIGTVEEAVKLAKSRVSFSKKIEVEVTSSSDALLAAKAGADIVMLDNFLPDEVEEASKKLRASGFGDVLLEVSGNITPENLLDYATAQVDIISIGALTHSVKALDISLEILKK